MCNVILNLRDFNCFRKASLHETIAHPPKVTLDLISRFLLAKVDLMHFCSKKQIGYIQPSLCNPI